MEEKSIDFTKRLIEKRIEHYTGKRPDYFFDTSSKGQSMDSFYELIFQISMNVPRIIGYILYYCYESKIAYDSPITRASLEDAAEKYFDLTINPFFQATTYSLKSFEEKISILQLRELLQIFVGELKEIRRKITVSELTEKFMMSFELILSQVISFSTPFTSSFSRLWS
jgi:hypothetical protein